MLELIKKMEELRGIPQFLFLSEISPTSTIQVRKEVISFKKENVESDKIDFIINSPGGSPGDAYRIIRTLRNNFKEVNIIVPFWAKSAATLLALGGNNIIMGEFGEFGPLDIQIGVEREDSPEFDVESALNDEYSVRQIEFRAQESFYKIFTNLYSSEDVKINKNDLSEQIFNYLSAFYQPLLKQINPYSLGKKKRLLDIGESYAVRILTTYNSELPEEHIFKLVDFLVNRCPDHGYVIDYNLLKNVSVLNNLKSTTDVGVDYDEIVKDLTSQFLEMQRSTYIGFLPPKALTSDKKEELKHNSNKNVQKDDLTESKTKSNGKHNEKAKPAKSNS